MADGMMTEQQMAQLLSLSGEDFDTETMTFAGKLPQRQADELRSAIQANDMTRVNTIVRNAPSSIDPKDVQKMQAAVQKNDFVVKMVEVNRALNQLTQKQQAGEELNKSEETFLSQKKQIEAGNKKLEEYYPKAFGKEDPKEKAAENSSDKAKGDFGFAGDWQFEDPKKMEWLPIFEKSVFDPLTKMGGEKDIGDFVITLGTTILVNMPLGMIAESINQKRTNKKESDKKAKDNREAAIDSNLKNRGLTRNDLASQLAHEAKNWLLNDAGYKDLPKTGPYTAYQKAMIEKRDFAAKLPRKPDGDLDWSKMDSKQRKKYAKYVTIYSQSPKWNSYMCEMCGVKIKPEEYEKQAKASAQMYVANQVAADKVSDGLDIPTAPEMPGIEQTTPKHTPTGPAPTGPVPTTPAPTHATTPTGPAPTGPAPTGPIPTTPAPTHATTPTGPAPTGPAPTGPIPTTPAPTHATTPTGPAPTGPAPTGPIPTTPAPTHATTPTMTAPTVIKDATKAEIARKTIEEAHQLPPLENVNVTGTPKKPMITDQNGNLVPYTPESYQDAKKNAERVKREITANNDAMNQVNQQLKTLENNRNGNQPGGVNLPTNIQQKTH